MCMPHWLKYITHGLVALVHPPAGQLLPTICLFPAFCSPSQTCPLVPCQPLISDAHHNVLSVLFKHPPEPTPHFSLTNPPAAWRGSAPEDHHLCCPVLVPGGPPGGLCPALPCLDTVLQPAQHPQEPHLGALLLLAHLLGRDQPNQEPSETTPLAFHRFP